MRARKTIGYVFILLAIILTITVIGLLPFLFKTVFNFFKIFTGKLDSSQIGYTIGSIIYWVIHISLTILLWIYGRKWTSKVTIK
jgi:hypothetical protein